jgi:hypothetical protein
MFRILIFYIAKAGDFETIKVLHAGATWRANQSTTAVPPDVEAAFATFVKELGRSQSPDKKSLTDGVTRLSKAYYAFWEAHKAHKGIRVECEQGWLWDKLGTYNLVALESRHSNLIFITSFLPPATQGLSTQQGDQLQRNASREERQVNHLTSCQTELWWRNWRPARRRSSAIRKRRGRK